LANTAGKEDPVELDSSLTLWRDTKGVAYYSISITITISISILVFIYLLKTLTDSQL